MNKKHNYSKVMTQFLVYLALIIFAVTIVVPVAWVFMASLKGNAEFYGRSPWALPEGLNFQNFIDAFEKANMGTYMVNSIIVTILALGFLLLIAIPAAYVLARYRFKGSKILNVVFMAGLFVNVNYIVVPIFLMLVDGDTFLRGHGMPPMLLNNLIMLALIYASTHLPFTVYLLSGFFASIPKDYEEAAFVDGSGYVRTMATIMIPMARPAVITIILFNFLAFWNEYIISMTLMTKDKFKTLPVGLMNLVSAQKASTNYGQLYAGLVIVMLPTLILYMLVQRRLTQGMSLGGLKG
ncbi:carbohydrate ABC transporter membrane protein 2 (CUT1 family) [Kineothrix alysoides]|jgi:N-acetylglucosamine transport system permease protein|uniref:Carbohydrate ABC transporter membrane protein 2 (CUT1 family) n=1 Tax=Kineothrix alysoides TaxID=1469948 RepID=A0A4R1R6A6_9FIRM|nr:carbohydrate ABC transporter permease [Kineothrix alysoides]TCL61096.1 carbohydrate ABC transporter membrane protein 2 (CUT1 family) [Kineothrix alysoides]